MEEKKVFLGTKEKVCEAWDSSGKTTTEDYKK